MPDDEPVDQRKSEIILPPEQMAGVWANFASVSHSEHEFTIDFVRMDGTAPPPGRGIVVARVAMSPLFITQLIDALQKNWSGYAQKAMPRDLLGGTTDGRADDERKAGGGTAEPGTDAPSGGPG
jgi:hypothetical protein